MHVGARQKRFTGTHKTQPKSFNSRVGLLYINIYIYIYIYGSEEPTLFPDIVYTVYYTRTRTHVSLYVSAYSVVVLLLFADVIPRIRASRGHIPL
jgi:hypothetical protein